jgi:hypothetical protein
VALALVPVGCNEGPAEEALAEARDALEEVQADLERDAPGDLVRLRGELGEAREALDDGRYTDSLRASQDLLQRIRDAADRVAGRREVLESAWEDLSRTIPGRLARLRSRLRNRVSSSTPVAGEPWLQDARSRLRDLESRWAAALRAFEGGELSRAVAETRAVEAGIEELADALGCAPGC